MNVELAGKQRMKMTSGEALRNRRWDGKNVRGDVGLAGDGLLRHLGHPERRIMKKRGGGLITICGVMCDDECLWSMGKLMRDAVFKKSYIFGDPG